MSETAAQPAKKRSRRKKKKNPASKVGTASETEVCDGIGPKVRLEGREESLENVIHDSSVCVAIYRPSRGSSSHQQVPEM